MHKCTDDTIVVEEMKLQLLLISSLHAAHHSFMYKLTHPKSILLPKQLPHRISITPLFTTPTVQKSSFIAMNVIIYLPSIYTSPDTLDASTHPHPASRYH
jgi:hypothetical protein